MSGKDDAAKMTDTRIKVRGMEILSKGLGMVSAERFISLMLHEKLDYTAWRAAQFGEGDFDELVQDIRDSRLDKGMRQGAGDESIS